MTGQHPPDPTAAFGASVRARREHLGLSLTDVARRVGLHHATVLHAEAGKNSPTLRTAGALAAALETTVADLLTGTTWKTCRCSLCGERRVAHRLKREVA